MNKRSPCESLPGYNIWAAMKRRCDKPYDTSYKWYGGRGIGYSQAWKTYDVFAQDMMPSYIPGLWLDRIDSNKGYSKENCKWSTPKEQQNNRRDNFKITIKGKTKNLCQWIEESGLKTSTVHQRIFTYGWTPDKALLTKVRRYSVK